MKTIAMNSARVKACAGDGGGNLMAELCRPLKFRVLGRGKDHHHQPQSPRAAELMRRINDNGGRALILIGNTGHPGHGQGSQAGPIAETMEGCF